MRPASRLSLNRETLRRLDPGQAQAAVGGVDRTVFQLSARDGALCSVSMGVTGNSLGCTSISLATSVVTIGVPH